MTSIHPFARSPNKEATTPSPHFYQTELFPSSSGIGVDGLEDEGDDGLRGIAYGVRSLGPGHGQTTQGQGQGWTGQVDQVQGRGLRGAPPASGPPSMDLPPLPQTTRQRPSNASIASYHTASSSTDHLQSQIRTRSPAHTQTYSQFEPHQEPHSVPPRPIPTDRTSSTSLPSSSRRTRVPSKDLLQSALDLAQKAVECDKTNDVPGALSMYREAVSRLRCVMERVGIELGPIPTGLGLMEPSEAEKEDIRQARRRREANGQRSGDEGKILKGIHDAYISRIGLLCVMESSIKKESDARGPIITDRQDQGVGSETATARPAGNSDGTSPDEYTRTQQEVPILGSVSNRVTRRSSLRAGEQLVHAIDQRENEPSSPQFRKGELDKDVQGYFPPALKQTPVPRARTSSIKGNVMAGPYELERAVGKRRRSNDSAVSLNQILEFGPDDTPRGSSNGHQDGSGAPGSSSWTVESPTFTVKSGSSSRRRSRFRSSIAASASHSLGLEEEMDQQEAQEVLSPSPLMHAQFEQGEPGSQDGMIRSTPYNAGLHQASGGVFPSYPSDSSSMHSRRSSATPPQISPRSASLGNGIFADQQAGTEGNIGCSVVQRPGSASSVRGVKGHNRARSIASVLEEEEISYEMVDHESLGTRRTTSTSSSRVPLGANAYQPPRQEPLQSSVPNGSSIYSDLSSNSGIPRARTVSQPSSSRSLSSRFEADNAPPVPYSGRAAYADLAQTGASLPPPMPPKALAINVHRATANANYSDFQASTSTATLIVPDGSEAHDHMVEPLLSSDVYEMAEPDPLSAITVEPPPTNSLHRPFHVLRLLRNTIASPSGGFLSARLHIPRAIWSQATVKLVSLDVKVKVIEVLIVISTSLTRSGDGLLAVSPPDRLNTPSRNKSQVPNVGKDFARALDDADGLLDEMEKLLSKKLGLKGNANSVKSKKMSTTGISVLGSKFTKTFDRIATGKNVDSPTAYVDSLSRLCLESQVIDSHLRYFTEKAPLSYEFLSTDLRSHIETKLRRMSEFFSNFVMTFVLQDVGFLLAKYLKQSSKWLED